jgi:hypothetical protein
LYGVHHCPLKQEYIDGSAIVLDISSKSGDGVPILSEILEYHEFPVSYY